MQAWVVSTMLVLKPWVAEEILKGLLTTGLGGQKFLKKGFDLRV